MAPVDPVTHIQFCVYTGGARGTLETENQLREEAVLTYEAHNRGGLGGQ